MSDSVWLHRRQPTRFPRPWDSPGKNTGMGCHFFLQCMKGKSESEVAQSCLTLHNPMDCSLPGSSIHGIFQARVLEWGAIAFSKNELLAPGFHTWLLSLAGTCLPLPFSSNQHFAFTIQCKHHLAENLWWRLFYMTPEVYASLLYSPLQHSKHAICLSS